MSDKDFNGYFRILLLYISKVNDSTSNAVGDLIWMLWVYFFYHISIVLKMLFSFFALSFQLLNLLIWE